MLKRRLSENYEPVISCQQEPINLRFESDLTAPTNSGKTSNNDEPSGSQHLYILE